MLRRDQNPSITFPENASVADMTGTWWVAHTKSRQEKAFAQDLQQRQLSYFLPLVEKLTIIRGRKFRPLVPLFPGYVFVCGSEDNRHEMFDGNRIARTIPVNDQNRLVQELTQVQRALAGRVRLDPWPYLREGARCRIARGACQGMEGIVTRRQGVTRIVLTVETLGQAVAFEVDAGLLEPVE